VSPWPMADEKRMDEMAERRGDLVMAIITEVRREKAEKHLPLNSKIAQLTIYAGDKTAAQAIEQGKEDIAGTCKATNVQVSAEKGKGREVKPHDIHFRAEY